MYSSYMGLPDARIGFPQRDRGLQYKEIKDKENIRTKDIVSLTPRHVTRFSSSAIFLLGKLL